VETLTLVVLPVIETRIQEARVGGEHLSFSIYHLSIANRGDEGKKGVVSKE